ncbi:MAG: hypothetical protein U0359_28310 [Byssovorax sp.]
MNGRISPLLPLLLLAGLYAALAGRYRLTARREIDVTMTREETKEPAQAVAGATRDEAFA